VALKNLKTLLKMMLLQLKKKKIKKNKFFIFKKDKSQIPKILIGFWVFLYLPLNK
jgi:hypothetical protein